MVLSRDEIEQIGKTVADKVIEKLEKAREEITTRDLLIGTVIGEGAIPVHGRENRKEPCHGCRIDPTKPLEAGNVMATTEGALGVLSKKEIEQWCSELIEVSDGRCERARSIREAAQKCKTQYPNDTQAYFNCFIPSLRKHA
jgi:hypothetical protein